MQQYSCIDKIYDNRKCLQNIEIKTVRAKTHETRYKESSELFFHQVKLRKPMQLDTNRVQSYFSPSKTFEAKFKCY